MAGQLWFFYALASAVLWGINYVVSEKILKAGFPLSLLACITSISVLIVYALFILTDKNAAIESMQNLVGNKKLALFFLVLILTTIMAVFTSYSAVALKNATYASLIEISYPVFVVLFSWLFFKEFHLNPMTILGAVMIFAGTMLVLWKS